MNKFKEILKSNILSEVKNYLKTLYNKDENVFTPADPYGQIVELQSELQQTNLAYLDKALRALDINDPANNNTKMIRSIARFSNYDALRARAATGTLLLKFKPGVDINSAIPGGEIILKDGMELNCIANGKIYTVNLGSELIKYSLTNIQDFIYINVLQGFYKETTFTGTGLPNQSFSIQTNNIGEIDQNNYKLTVGGKTWKKVQGRNDMLPGDECYYARTGIDSSLDIYTGDDNYGKIIPAQSVVTVKYLITEGELGNIVNSNVNIFKFSDEIFDSFGNPIDIENIFDIFISTPINFGANGETVEFTKSILPSVSTNNILMMPKHYEFYFKRLNIFSTIKVFKSPTIDKSNINILLNKIEENTNLLNNIIVNNDPNLKNLVRTNLDVCNKTLKLLSSISQSDIINILLVPDVKKYYANFKNLDYFSIDINAFILDEYEKNKIKELLEINNEQTITSEFVIIDPVIVKYALNIVVRLFNDANESNVRSIIKSKISDYMLNNKRMDRIPPSDFIALLEGIDGIDSTDVSFISEQNEKYHLEYNKQVLEFQKRNGRLPLDGEVKMLDGSNYNKNLILKIDPILGDALINNDEIFMIRGDFYDRNGNYYADNADGKGNCALNIIFTADKTKR